VLVNPSLSQAYRMRNGWMCCNCMGKETTNFCRKLGEMSVRFWKAIPCVRIALRHGYFLRRASLFWMLRQTMASAHWRDVFHGSGRASFIAANVSQKVILAGGLTPENVAEAIKQVEPFGVDVTKRSGSGGRTQRHSQGS